MNKNKIKTKTTKITNQKIHIIPTKLQIIVETNLPEYTPLNIYNGTPLGVTQDVKGQPLPINQLKGNPPREDCSISNVHRCINRIKQRCKRLMG